MKLSAFFLLLIFVFSQAVVVAMRAGCAVSSFPTRYVGVNMCGCPNTPQAASLSCSSGSVVIIRDIIYGKTHSGLNYCPDTFPCDHKASYTACEYRLSEHCDDPVFTSLLTACNGQRSCQLEYIQHPITCGSSSVQMNDYTFITYGCVSSALFARSCEQTSVIRHHLDGSHLYLGSAGFPDPPPAVLPGGATAGTGTCACSVTGRVRRTHLVQFNNDAYTHFRFRHTNQGVPVSILETNTQLFSTDLDTEETYDGVHFELEYRAAPSNASMLILIPNENELHVSCTWTPGTFVTSRTTSATTPTTTSATTSSTQRVTSSTTSRTTHATSPVTRVTSSSSRRTSFTSARPVSSTSSISSTTSNGTRTDESEEGLPTVMIYVFASLGAFAALLLLVLCVICLCKRKGLLVKKGLDPPLHMQDPRTLTRTASLSSSHLSLDPPNITTPDSETYATIDKDGNHILGFGNATKPYNGDIKTNGFDSPGIVGTNEVKHNGVIDSPGLVNTTALQSASYQRKIGEMMLNGALSQSQHSLHKGVTFADQPDVTMKSFPGTPNHSTTGTPNLNRPVVYSQPLKNGAVPAVFMPGFDDDRL